MKGAEMMTMLLRVLNKPKITDFQLKTKQHKDQSDCAICDRKNCISDDESQDRGNFLSYHIARFRENVFGDDSCCHPGHYFRFTPVMFRRVKIRKRQREWEAVVDVRSLKRSDDVAAMHIMHKHSADAKCKSKDDILIVTIIINN